MSDNYLGLGNGEEALREFLKYKKICQQVKGCFTLLWHNSEIKYNFNLYNKVVWGD